ncbi:hypothetical protein AB7M17_000949 [Bradyrhizobium sp. USDA 377]
MRASSLILALVMQTAVTVSLAQDASKAVDVNGSVRKPIPEEDKDFVAEFESALRKFPRAAARYRLTDFGQNPVWSCPWDCQGWPDGFVDCRPVCEAQR